MACQEYLKHYEIKAGALQREFEDMKWVFKRNVQDYNKMTKKVDDFETKLGNISHAVEWIENIENREVRHSITVDGLIGKV